MAYHGRIAAGGMGAVLVEGSYIMLERLDKRVNVADNDSRMTIEESPLVATCQALEAAGADALELRLGTFAFHEAQFVNDGVFAGYGYDGATSFGTFFDFDSHFSGLLDGSHSGCGLIMGACRNVKQHVSIPVGGVVFMDPALAPDYFENALNEGWLDMIYMHRPVANCDAEYANKLRENRIDEIRPCCRCRNCLGGLCRVNPCNNSVFTDAMPEGYEVRPADGDKSVMVIGGGPAGMEAARVAAERGYAVTLYEKNGLGGLLDFAEMVKGKHESLGRLRNYLSHMLEVEGVNVVTGQEVDAAFVREQSPDVVIVATDGVRPELAAAGSSATPVIGVTDFLASEIGDHVAVLGFNAQATDTAHYLIAQGKKVTVIAPEPAEAFGAGQSMMLNAFVKPAFFAAGGRLMPECTLKSVGDGEIVVTNNFGMDVTLACDCVVDASTMSPNTALADELSGEFDVHVIGDAAEPSSIQNAITTGNLTVRNC